MSIWFKNQTQGTSMPSIAYRNSCVVGTFLAVLRRNGVGIPEASTRWEREFEERDVQVVLALQGQSEGLMACVQQACELSDHLLVANYPEFRDTIERRGSWSGEREWALERLLEFFSEIQPGDVVAYHG